jgi:mannitol/fructose-specific phosphotransferase system IIA component (Ntr-type)
MNSSDLARLFRPTFFLPNLKSKDKEKIMEELVQPLLDSGLVKSKRLVLDTLGKRETLGSTGIGKGVAIPHCRTLAVSDVQVVAGVSQAGVDFNAVDEKKVNLLFLIVAPPHDSSNLYLPILGKIVEIVRDTKMRKALIQADTFETFIQIIRGE